MAVAPVDDPQERVAQLEVERRRAAFDVSVGKAGSQAKLAAIEGALDEARRALERARLVEEERAHREVQQAQRQRERQRSETQNQIEKTSGELRNAYADIEAARQPLVDAVKRAVAIGAERQMLTSKLHNLDGTKDAYRPDDTKDRLTDRLSFVLNRECGLTDVRCNATYNLGGTPLTAIETEPSQ
jgi:hypothetical protein